MKCPRWFSYNRMVARLIFAHDIRLSMGVVKRWRVYHLRVFLVSSLFVLSWLTHNRIKDDRIILNFIICSLFIPPSPKLLD